jgi:hypothetical protein
MKGKRYTRGTPRFLQLENVPKISIFGQIFKVFFNLRNVLKFLVLVGFNKVESIFANAKNLPQETLTDYVLI